MPHTPDVVMARSIYDDNDNKLLPKALVINQEPGLKESLIDPNMERSNNTSSEYHDDDCDGFCDLFCGTLLTCCCIFGACDY